MTNSQRLAEVRERLCDWLAAQPPGDSEQETAKIVGESVLIVDGFYCGRRFDAGRCYAIWFIEEDELKIHAAGGELLRVFSSDELGPVTMREAPNREEALRQDDREPNHPADVISLSQLDSRAVNDEPTGDNKTAVDRSDDSDDIRRAA